MRKTGVAMDSRNDPEGIRFDFRVDPGYDGGESGRQAAQWMEQVPLVCVPVRFEPGLLLCAWT